jgi:hypothetical protein
MSYTSAYSSFQIKLADPLDEKHPDEVVLLSRLMNRYT